MKKLVLFDFDGVLANTLELAYKIHHDKNTSLTWERFCELSNENFHDALKKMEEEEGYIVPHDFREKYDNGIETISIHDVIRESVMALSLKYNLYVVSSSRSDFIQKFLTKEKIQDKFVDLFGSDVASSKVVKIKMILERENISPENAVFITDSLGDILEATECGVKSIGVLWGIHPHGTLEKGKPFAIIDDPLYLLETIDKALE